MLRPRVPAHGPHAPTMLRACLLALGDLFAPRIAALLGATVLLSLATFFLVWWGIDRAMDTWVPDPEAWSTWLDWLGALLTFVLAWFLFPLVTSAFLALFLEPIAAAVEALHYPAAGPAPGLPLWTALGATLRLLGLVVACNLLLLVVLVAFPVAYPFAWLIGNGWLLGREYFELVGLRRLAPVEARAVQARHGGEVLVGGIVIVLLSTLPVVNLVAPVFATALMVHRHAAWRGDPQSAGG